MEEIKKSEKLGISIGLLGAIMCFSCIFGGYIVAFMVAGYILLCEQDKWLRRLTIKALCLLLGFSAIMTLVSFLPSILGFLNSFIQLFDTSIPFAYKFTQFFDVINTGLSLFRTVVFFCLGYKALKGADFKLSILDQFTEKLLGKESEPAENS